MVLRLRCIFIFMQRQRQRQQQRQRMDSISLKQTKLNQTHLPIFECWWQNDMRLNGLNLKMSSGGVGNSKLNAPHIHTGMTATTTTKWICAKLWHEQKHTQSVFDSDSFEKNAKCNANIQTNENRILNEKEMNVRDTSHANSNDRPI